MLTHGVGPMRVYVIGALLLDLDDPACVMGYSRTPLLAPGPDEQDGYVPNVAYSCGAFLHDGLVWIPYGVDDCRIGVASKRPCVAGRLLDRLWPAARPSYLVFVLGGGRWG